MFQTNIEFPENNHPTCCPLGWLRIESTSQPRLVSGIFSIDFNVCEIKFLTGNSKVPPNHVLCIMRLVCSYARQNTLLFLCLCQARLSLTVGLFCFFLCFFWNISLYCPHALPRAGNYQHIYEMVFDCSKDVFIIAAGTACSALIAVVQNLSETNTVECPRVLCPEEMDVNICLP